MQRCEVLTFAPLCPGINWESFWLPWIGFGSETFQNYETFITVLWITAFVGLLSTLIGLSLGARTFVIGGIIFSLYVAFAVFFMDDTWYLLNLMTQSVGYYFFYLIKLAHHVDAFEKVDSGVDAKAQLTPWFDGWDGNGW